MSDDSVWLDKFSEISGFRKSDTGPPLDYDSLGGWEFGGLVVGVDVDLDTGHATSNRITLTTTVRQPDKYR